MQHFDLFFSLNASVICVEEVGTRFRLVTFLSLEGVCAVCCVHRPCAPHCVLCCRRCVRSALSSPPPLSLAPPALTGRAASGSRRSANPPPAPDTSAHSAFPLSPHVQRPPLSHFLFCCSAPISHSVYCRIWSYFNPPLPSFSFFRSFATRKQTLDDDIQSATLLSTPCCCETVCCVCHLVVLL